MRDEKRNRELCGFFFLECLSAKALQSGLLIRIGKQNVEIIDK